MRAAFLFLQRKKANIVTASTDRKVEKDGFILKRPKNPETLAVSSRSGHTLDSSLRSE